MSEPLARLYDLALRTVDDQERRADALRGHLGPTLAAAALGVTLLSGSIAGGDSPASVAGTVALVVAVGGLFVALGAAASMLRSRDRTSADVDLRQLATELADEGAVDDVPRFYTEMISRLSRQIAEGEARLERLDANFTAMLCGILAMLCGLAAEAIVG